MLQPVPVGSKDLADYTHLVGRPLTQEIRDLAEGLEGLRVLHLSATAFGGGVSEILYTLVPLMRDVGIEAEWQVIIGREEFFNATKLLHNALQGNPLDLSPEEWTVWEQYNEMNARELEGGWDVVIVHDPQPAAIRGPREREGRQLGLALPHRPVDAPPAHDPPAGAPAPGLRRVRLPRRGLHPARASRRTAGPTSAPRRSTRCRRRTCALSPEDAAFVCDQFGLDVDRPLMCQVSRFDPWKDPIGVIDAYRKVTDVMPEVQLALVGSMATDDPEGWTYFNSTMEYADGDPDILILNNLNNVGAIEVNAFQSQADVVIQKSTREGFGLTVSEALWKARPFIGGDVGGIPLQVHDGSTGFLVSTPDACADRSLEILREPELGMRLGRTGKEHVRVNFLMPRLLRDWLRIFGDLR